MLCKTPTSSVPRRMYHVSFCFSWVRTVLYMENWNGLTLFGQGKSRHFLVGSNVIGYLNIFRFSEYDNCDLYQFGMQFGVSWP
jgi:hypothetical protein